MDADGRNLRRLTTEAGNEGDPAWTPDGARIVYTFTQGCTAPALRASARRQSFAGAHERSRRQSLGDGLRRRAHPGLRLHPRRQSGDLPDAGRKGEMRAEQTTTEQRESLPRFLPNGDLVFAVERGDRSKGSRVVRLSGAAGGVQTLLETDEPIGGLAVSRDGGRIAYVVGRLTDAARGRAQFKLFVQPLATGHLGKRS